MASCVKHNAIRCAPSRFRFASSRWRAFALQEQKTAVCGMQAFQAIIFLFLHSSLQYQNSTTRQKTSSQMPILLGFCELLKIIQTLPKGSIIKSKMLILCGIPPHLFHLMLLFSYRFQKLQQQISCNYSILLPRNPQQI